MMIFGEGIVLLTNYNMLVFTDFVLDVKAKGIMGIVMIVITVIGALVYLVMMYIDHC
jgi:hypothetical protein